MVDKFRVEALFQPSRKNRDNFTYRCTGPQWQSWGYGNPDRHPCTNDAVFQSQPLRSFSCVSPVSSSMVVFFCRGITHATLAGALCLALGNERDVGLLLEGTLRLNGEFGRHFDGCWSWLVGDGEAWWGTGTQQGWRMDESIKSSWWERNRRAGPPIKFFPA